jgi:hypothetical protein
VTRLAGRPGLRGGYAITSLPCAAGHAVVEFGGFPRWAEDCAASGLPAAPVFCAVEVMRGGKTDQRAGAHTGRTRPLVVPAADRQEPPRRRRWRRLRRSAPAPPMGHQYPGSWPEHLARWCYAAPAPPSWCTASSLPPCTVSTPTIHVRDAAAVPGRPAWSDGPGRHQVGIARPVCAQTLTGAFAAAPPCTGSPFSVTTLVSSIAWAASERLTVILRGWAFSATGITSRKTPSW